MPYYDVVENYVGISGAAEGNDALPDGRFLPPMKMTCGEVHMREVAKSKFGYTLTIGRVAMLTKNHNGRARVPLLRTVRARLPDVLVLQQSIHDGEGRAEDRALHADP